MVVQEVICAVVTIYLIVLIVRAVLSWVPSLPDPVQPLASGVRALTDPVLLPLRGMFPPLQIGCAALDLSFLVVLFAVSIIRSLIC